MSGFNENEISVNAFGGTEIAKRSLASVIDPALLANTQIVCSRIRELDPAKIRIFWAHDLPHDPESAQLKNKALQEKFHHMVFISNWQYQQYRTVLGLPYSHAHSVIETGIEPAPLKDKPTDTIRLVYTSTPQRGLQILLPVFDALCKKYTNIHLDVYSSFKIYGWDDADKQFEPLYQMCREHPHITYKGFVPNQQLKDELLDAHIFAYPCIWPETSCRAMLEAMSARLLCVHPNFAALPDTAANMTMMYQGDDDINAHANIFYAALDASIRQWQDNPERILTGSHMVKKYVDARFGMENITAQWTSLLGDLNTQYSTEDSRAFPILQTPTFNYTTR